MAVGYAEIGIVAFLVFVSCFAPGLIAATKYHGRWLVGGFALLVMVASVLAKVVRQVGRESRRNVT